jgi:hypothetical protein
MMHRRERLNHKQLRTRTLPARQPGRCRCASDRQSSNSAIFRRAGQLLRLPGVLRDRPDAAACLNRAGLNLALAKLDKALRRQAEVRRLPADE